IPLCGYCLRTGCAPCGCCWRPWCTPLRVLSAAWARPLRVLFAIGWFTLNGGAEARHLQAAAGAARQRSYLSSDRTTSLNLYFTVLFSKNNLQRREDAFCLVFLTGEHQYAPCLAKIAT